MEKVDLKMKPEYPSVSVVIPVKNEGKKIRKCIEGILSQTVPVTEIIVIDSGSDDDTCDILKEYEIVTLIEINPSDFGHGKTRNLGVCHAKGEFVLLTVGDAWAYNEFWIEELLKGFTDQDVAGVCGQQVVPHDLDKNPVEWFVPQSKPEIKRFQFRSRDMWDALSPLEKKNACGWDDVTALYRRSALQATPFQEVSYCEDAIWAKQVLQKGKALVYNYNARVYHYHKEDEDFTFRKSFTVHFFRYQYFGFVPQKNKKSILWHSKLIRLLFRRLQMDFGKVVYWYLYNVKAHNAVLKANDVFHKELNKGGAALASAHFKYCGKPPIPVK